MESKKTVVVALDKKSDVAAFLKFIAAEKESCDIILTSVNLPCWTNDDSILTIGEILNVYVTTISDVKHEVIGMLNWNDADDLYFSMLKEVNYNSERYGFSPVDFAEITMRLLLRQNITNKYNASTIIIGEEIDDTKLGINSSIIDIINSLMNVKANIYNIDSNDTSVDEFVVNHDIAEYNSFRQYRFERAVFKDTKAINYSAYIADIIKPFVDKIITEGIDISLGND